MCLLAAGAAVIVTVGANALRGQFVRQAGDQLRAYAQQFTSHSFQLLGTSQGAPVTVVPFAVAGTAAGARTPGTAGAAGTPGAARMAGAAGAPDALVTRVARVAGAGAISLELRDARGQLLLSVGPGSRPGRAVPAPFAAVPVRTGVLRTVPAAGGGDCLVIAEPVHVQVRRLLFGYGADDFVITGGARGGQVGTLLVGVRLAGIGQAVRQLTLLAVAVSAAVILLAGGLAWAAIRFSLRPVTRAAQTADAVAADPVGAGPVAADAVAPGPVGAGPVGAGLVGADAVAPDAVAAGGASSGVPRRGEGGLAGSLGSMLSELDARFTASTAAEAATRSATDQVGRSVESVAESLRRPVSLLHGLAEHWAHRDRPGTADADRALAQLAAETARAEALLDQADRELTEEVPHFHASRPPLGESSFTRLARQTRTNRARDAPNA